MGAKLVATLALAALFNIACSAGEPSSTSTSTSSTAPAVGERKAIDWADPSVTAEFDGGWAIRACEGDGPFLCVERDGIPVGSLEAAAYPISSIDALDPSADTEANLRKLADVFVASLSADRAIGCGPDYQVTPIEPKSFPIGDSGLAYGFEGSMADGSPSELNLQYATIVGDELISIIAAAYDESGCPGRDDLSGFDSATLRDFQDYMEIVLANSPLPDLTGR